MSYQDTSPLPSELLKNSYAVPATSTAISTVDTDVERVTLTSSDGAAHTFTMTDAAGNKKGLDTVTVDPGVPVSFEFHPPIRCTGGVKVSSGTTGLLLDLEGKKLAGFTGVIRT